MKQTGFVVSSGRSDFSDAQISDEHVAQVNYQFSFYFFTPFFSNIQTFRVKQSLLVQMFWYFYALMILLATVH